MAKKIRAAANRMMQIASTIHVMDVDGKFSASNLETLLLEIATALTGITEDVGELEGMAASLQLMVSGDMALECDPETLGSSAAAVNAAIAGDGFSREVTVSLVDTEGNKLIAFNGTLPVGVATSSNGTEAANIDEATTLTFVEGEASITINYTGSWAAADTCTLTVGDTSSILGYPVLDATSVDTLVE
jgi:hypothetical protein